MKLKQLLKETKAWERKFGESLPTLEDTTKAYKLKLEQEFKAKSKETGRVVVYKSKENMDKAIKGGKAEPLDKKTSGKPEKVKGANLFKKDKPKAGTKPKGDTTADTLTKGLKDGGLNPYKDGPMINQALDDIGGDHSDLKKKIDTYGDNLPSSKGKSEAQYQKEIDKYKEEGKKLSNDIADAVSDKPKVWTRVKDGKLKSTGPQQFADDVKNIEGDYDLGGVKIKNGKMFNADGEEMDLDDIEDFYYQDAFDEKGNNVGIDIKEGMIKLKSLLKEGKVWERKFGEPLPTLNSVMEKHQQKEGGKGSGKKSKKTSDKKQKDTEKEMELKAMKQALKDMENESVDEQGILSRRAGINVFGDKKLHLITKNLRQTAFDLEKVAKKKDEQAFDDILQRITITVGVLRSYLNKPKRRM